MKIPYIAEPDMFSTAVTIHFRSTISLPKDKPEQITVSQSTPEQINQLITEIDRRLTLDYLNNLYKSRKEYTKYKPTQQLIDLYQATERLLGIAAENKQNNTALVGAAKHIKQITQQPTSIAKLNKIIAIYSNS